MNNEEYIAERIKKLEEENKNLNEIVKELQINIDRPIFVKICIHHIEPITIDDIRHSREKLLDPNNLICEKWQIYSRHRIMRSKCKGGFRR